MAARILGELSSRRIPRMRFARASATVSGVRMLSRRPSSCLSGEVDKPWS